MYARTIALVSFVILSSTVVHAGLFDWAEKRDDRACKSYGAVPGTDAYINCRLVLEQNRRAAFGNLSNYFLQQQQLQQQQQYQQQLLFQQQQRQFNCTSNQFGNTIHTNCY